MLYKYEEITGKYNKYSSYYINIIKMRMCYLSKTLIIKNETEWMKWWNMLSM